MDIVLIIGYYIGLFIALAAIILNVILLLITLKTDKPIRQDDHDYSDDYTDPVKILGGTCNWDEEKERAEKQFECIYCTDKEFFKTKVDKVVEQLEEVRDELLHSTDYSSDVINYCLDWFDIVIDIVKGAVKDE